MTNTNQLVEQHIREHEARLKHIDELMEQVEQAGRTAADSAEIFTEVEDLKQQRAQLANHLEELRRKSIEEWSEKGGPMVMWDIVANRLETLVERVKH